MSNLAMFLEGFNDSTFCADTFAIWHFIGICLRIFQIVIPVVIIVWGVILFGKAVISSDDKQIDAAWKSLVKKLIVAVAIFFIPSLVAGIFSLVNWAGDLNWRECVNALGF